MSDLEFVRVRECPDGSHADGDGVWIPRRPSLDCGMAARQDMTIVAKEYGDRPFEEAEPALLRRWFQTYARLAPAAWNLHDEDGTEWPFDPGRLVEDFDLGYPVADRADDLYREVVMRPLLTALPSTSPNGQRAPSTSRATTSTRRPRRRSSGGPTAGPQSQARTA